MQLQQAFQLAAKVSVGEDPALQELIDLRLAVGFPCFPTWARAPNFSLCCCPQLAMSLPGCCWIENCFVQTPFSSSFDQR